MNSSSSARVTNERLASLLEAARAGDKACLNEIVRELTPMLWHVARAQGADRETAADIVQHTWLTLLGSLDGIRSPGALTGWLVTVTKREAWRVVRLRRGEQPFADEQFEDTMDPEPGPEDQVLTQAGHAELWRVMQQLPERCQRLLRIVAFVHRPDYGAISAELGVPRGTIGPTRGRCLAQLKNLLVAEGEFDGRG